MITCVGITCVQMSLVTEMLVVITRVEMSLVVEKTCVQMSLVIIYVEISLPSSLLLLSSHPLVLLCSRNLCLLTCTNPYIYTNLS